MKKPRKPIQFITLREQEKVKLAESAGWTLWETGEDEMDNQIAPSEEIIRKLKVRKDYFSKRIFIIISPFKFLERKLDIGGSNE